jgi:hypothetical protein
VAARRLGRRQPVEGVVRELHILRPVPVIDDPPDRPVVGPVFVVS